MKNLLIIASIVCLFIACDNGGMNEETNTAKDPDYLTVTYHGNGHTSGEPPVDTRQYKKPKDIDPAAGDIEKATVLPRGTMEKEGYLFDGWLMRSYSNPDEHYHQVYYPDPNNPFAREFYVSADTDLDAVWKPPY